MQGPRGFRASRAAGAPGARTRLSPNLSDSPKESVILVIIVIMVIIVIIVILVIIVIIVIIVIMVIIIIVILKTEVRFLAMYTLTLNC